MNRMFGLAAGGFLFVLGCGGVEADSSRSSMVSVQLGQEAEGDDGLGEISPITGPISGKLDGAAFTGTMVVVDFVDEDNTVFVNVKVTDVSGLPAAAAAKLKGTVVKLPLAVEPEGGFPTDGSEPLCEVLTVFSPSNEQKSAAGALSFDRTELDFSATPGTNVVLGLNVCSREPDVLTKGGALTKLADETAVAIVQLLNGIVGAPVEAPSGPAVDEPASKPAAGALR